MQSTRGDASGTCVGAWLATDLIDAFVSAKFSTDEDFRRRVAKLHAMDAEG